MPSRGNEAHTAPRYLPFPASEGGDLYISYWLKVQPGLEVLMGVAPAGVGVWLWRTFFGWTTAGDYRVIDQVKSDPWINGGALFRSVMGDNEAVCGLPYQVFWGEHIYSRVPLGEWFKFEVFWRCGSGSDGRMGAAVNSVQIVDHYGPNFGVNNASIDRIFPSSL